MRDNEKAFEPTSREQSNHDQIIDSSKFVCASVFVLISVSKTATHTRDLLVSTSLAGTQLFLLDASSIYAIPALGTSLYYVVYLGYDICHLIEDWHFLRKYLNCAKRVAVSQFRSVIDFCIKYTNRRAAKMETSFL